MSIKVSDVMLVCAKLLKNEALAAAISGEQTAASGAQTANASGQSSAASSAGSTETAASATAAEKIAEEREDMLRVYNMITEELSCEYFPLYHEQTLTAQNGKIKLSSLKYPPLKIVSVREETSGKPVNYGFSGGAITVESKNGVVIKYTYAAQESAETDDFIFTPAPGKFVVAYGMAAQLCLENALTGEADIWQNKYDSAIRGRVAERRTLKIKPRRWY